MEHSQSQFSNFPLYLKATDIKDAFQVSQNTALEMMRQSGLMLSVGKSGKTKRLHRDRFFEWALEREGKK